MQPFTILSLATVASAFTGTASSFATGTGASIYPTATGSSSAVPPIYTVYPAAGNTHKASGAALAVVAVAAAYVL